MGRRRSETVPEARERATKEYEFMQIRAVLDPEESDMTRLVSTVEHIAEDFDTPPSEVARVARSFAAQGFNVPDICEGCGIAVKFADR